MKKRNLLIGLLALTCLTGCNAPQTDSSAAASESSSVVSSSSAADGKKVYVFEAENSPDIETAKVPDFSGTRLGDEVIGNESPDHEWNCSGGYFVFPMAKPQAFLSFTFNSDKAVSDATFIWRISGYCYNLHLYKGFYDIYVNGVALDYDLEVTGVPGYTQGYKAFEDYTITTNLSLKEGENKVIFYTANNVNPGGTTSTYQATAPCIDCFKIVTDAVLTWEPTQYK